MRKKITALLLAVSLTTVFVCSNLTSLTVFAQEDMSEDAADTIETGDYTYQELEDGTLEITGYTGSDTEIVIPAKIDGKAVSGIGANAFCYSAVRSIEIPESMMKIGDWAFVNCFGLESIKLPSSLTEIGTYAFSCCVSLKSIEIPESVVEIQLGAFYSCRSLKDIVIPKNVTKIGTGVFDACSNLLNITVHKDNEHYFSKEGVLYDKNMTTLIKWPEGKQGEVVFPENITCIGERAFYGCHTLTDIKIPKGVTHIWDMAFQVCENLVSIEIPQSVTLIAGNVFNGCSSELVLSVVEGSYAETYAKENGIAYKYQESSTENPEEPENPNDPENPENPENPNDPENPENPENQENNGYRYRLLEDDTVAITGYSGDSKELVIPEEIEGKHVSSIEKRAFLEYKSITSVTLPESLTSIGDEAFIYCENLANITIPASVSDFGCFAFHGTKWIENERSKNPLVVVNNILLDGEACVGNVEIPEGVREIGGAAFSNNAMLCGIKFSEGIKKIGKSAFQNCSNLNNVKLPESVTEIGAEAFSACHSLNSIKLMGNVTKIGNEAFGFDGSLVNIELPESVTEIGDKAFLNCMKLEYIEIPKNVRTVGKGVFLACWKLCNITVDNDNKYYTSQEGVLYDKNITRLIQCPAGKAENFKIPESVMEIDDEAFELCKDIKNIEVPENVTRIGNRAFASCNSLKRINIPKSVTSIADDAFIGCGSELVLKVAKDSYAENYAKANGIAYKYQESGTENPNEPENPENNGYRYKLLEDGTLEITKYTGSDTVIVVPAEIDGKHVTRIGDYAFLCYEELVSVTIPGGVTSIGSYAFEECFALESIMFPESLTEIGGSAFRASGLRSVSIPKNVEKIGSSVFSECSNLSSVELPEGLSKIGDGAFQFCGKLKDVKIPESVTSIGGCAFEDCISLENMEISKNVIEIGGMAFSGCTGLEAIEVDSENAYYLSLDGVLYNKNITELMQCPAGKKGTVVIPDSVTEIGRWAFYGCGALTGIHIPDSVASFGESVFMDCSGLTSIEIPDSVTFLDYQTFCGCTSLESIKLPQRLNQDIEHGTFAQCESLNSLEIPEGVTGISGWIFPGCSNLKDITIPASVTVMDEEVFSECSEELVLHVVEGSYAEDYAKENNIKYSYVEGMGNNDNPSCSHTWRNTITKATTKKNGILIQTCTKCGDKTTTTIYAPKTINFSTSSVTYNNKNQKPSVTVKDSKGKALKYNTDYTVSYPKDMKNVGQYTVTINFKGNYNGTVKKTFTVVPKGTSISKITPKKKGFTVKWKKQEAQTTGYEIAYSTDSSFSKKNAKTIPVAKNNLTSKSVTKLRTKKKYYVRIRTYKTVNGKRYYSDWSKVKDVTTKK